MNEVYVIRNQDGLYASKQDQWVDGNDKSVVAFVKYRDQAVNTLVELNAKDVELRGDIVAVELNDKKRPQVVVGEKPEPRLFELPAADEAEASDEHTESLATTEVDTDENVVIPR
ncbi:MAG: hypothetical protein ACJAQS_001063 [Porticoccus sp.]|jgi:hypothetical protein